MKQEIELVCVTKKNDENWGSASLELAVKDHDEVDQDLSLHYCARNYCHDTLHWPLACKITFASKISTTTDCRLGMQMWQKISINATFQISARF